MKSIYCFSHFQNKNVKHLMERGTYFVTKKNLLICKPAKQPVSYLLQLGQKINRPLQLQQILNLCLSDAQYEGDTV